MSNGNLPDRDRFGGIERLYGPQVLEKLAVSRVAVIGLGGVGGWSAEALARSGVGTIRLFDLDDVCISNSNRQVQALLGTFGQLKVEALTERLMQINPGLCVQARACFVTARNVAEALQDIDFVIEATDSVKAKAAILSHCRRNKIRVICSGAAGGRLDPSQIQVADLSRTYHDALLARLRRELRQHHGFPANPQRRFGVEAVFSVEQARYPDAEGQPCAAKPGAGARGQIGCDGGYGAAMPVTATFGLIAASRALARLTR